MTLDGPKEGPTPLMPGRSGTQPKRSCLEQDSEGIRSDLTLIIWCSVVFMDEPTSGLDARAAAIVMRCIKNVSRSGRSILVTIHQPSIEIFETFDSLVLLQRGGRVSTTPCVPRFLTHVLNGNGQTAPHQHVA